MIYVLPHRRVEMCGHTLVEHCRSQSSYHRYGLCSRKPHQSGISKSSNGESIRTFGSDHISYITQRMVCAPFFHTVRLTESVKKCKRKTLNV